MNNEASVPSLQGGKGESPKYKNAEPMEYGLLKAYARENRKNQTDAESALWNHIKGKSLGVIFLRQYIIGDYITDFACLEPKLVIEVDGGYHSEPRQVEDDAIRQKRLEKQGFKVIRFTNAEIECDIDNIINKIRKAIHHGSLCKEGEKGLDGFKEFPPFKEG
ncbi:MAG: endonuclease domain-containing protein [Bacteroidaceae bacterium]|nr:endonuclease domain-containing protein [Bacteroidaceae bacterium]